MRAAAAFSTLDAASLRRPPRLRPGDSVGVFAPSVPSAAWYPERFEQAIRGICASLGVELVVPPQATTQSGFRAGDARTRAETLRSLLVNPSIRAIFTTIGGYNGNEILELLSPEEVARHPKIVVGYSDTTSLLLGLQAMGGWYTFHGPAMMTQFGENPQPQGYTIERLRQVIMEGRSPQVLDDPEAWTNEFLDWGTQAWRERPRQMNPSAAREVWRPGRGKGYLFGGNIDTLNFLIGTGFLSIPEEVVFFWEACEEAAYLPLVQRALTQLRQIGLFERTRAMLIGRSPDCRPVRGTTLHDVVSEAVADYAFPVIAELPFGHTDPMFTLPLGAPVRVEAESTAATIELLAPAVE